MDHPQPQAAMLQPPLGVGAPTTQTTVGSSLRKRLLFWRGSTRQHPFARRSTLARPITRCYFIPQKRIFSPTRPSTFSAYVDTHAYCLSSVLAIALALSTSQKAPLCKYERVRERHQQEPLHSFTYLLHVQRSGRRTSLFPQYTSYQLVRTFSAAAVPPASAECKRTKTKKNHGTVLCRGEKQVCR